MAYTMTVKRNQQAQQMIKRQATMMKPQKYRMSKKQMFTIHCLTSIQSGL